MTATPLRRVLPQLLVAPLALAAPGYSPRDAVRAEWARRAPQLDEAARAALPEADRRRLALSVKRIGAPGADPLLPPELDHPDVATWEARALTARTPAERMTALALLNRLKSMHALSALAGLDVAAAASWPRHLHLDGQVATARLRGEVPDAPLRAFLAALPVDPVRAQAARVRLVLEGKEQALLPLLPPTPGAVLAMLEAWNRAPAAARLADHLALLAMVARHLAAPAALAAELGRSGSPWSHLGLLPPAAAALPPSLRGVAVRLLEGLPDPAPAAAIPSVLLALRATDVAIHRAALEALGKLRSAPAPAPAVASTVGVPPAAVRRAARAEAHAGDPRLLVALLPSLRKLLPAEADALRARLLAGPDAIARAAAIEDLAAPPPEVDLARVAARVFADTDVDSLQALIAAAERWKLDPPRRRALLAPFLAHHTFIGRYEAWRALAAVGEPPAWPEAPAATPVEAQVLALAEILAEAGRPVRLAITFAGGRRVVLALDAALAPENVANLVLLARRGFFDGQRVPRVVPDFVVQLGSPLDTMDGGPGYSVRCELSDAWYGPGSVGMALSGKDTGGSQFFITTNATPHLTGRYTRLGSVEDPDQALPLLDDLELGARIEHIEPLP